MTLYNSARRNLIHQKNMTTRGCGLLWLRKLKTFSPYHNSKISWRKWSLGYVLQKKNANTKLIWWKTWRPGCVWSHCLYLIKKLWMSRLLSWNQLLRIENGVAEIVTIEKLLKYIWSVDKHSRQGTGLSQISQFPIHHTQLCILYASLQ